MFSPSHILYHRFKSTFFLIHIPYCMMIEVTFLLQSYGMEKGRGVRGGSNNTFSPSHISCTIGLQALSFLSHISIYRMITRVIFCLQVMDL